MKPLAGALHAQSVLPAQAVVESIYRGCRVGRAERSPPKTFRTGQTESIDNKSAGQLFMNLQGKALNLIVSSSTNRDLQRKGCDTCAILANFCQNFLKIPLPGSSKDPNAPDGRPPAAFGASRARYACSIMPGWRWKGPESHNHWNNFVPFGSAAWFETGINFSRFTEF